jgi:hemolysin activation/secretion protein
MCDPGAATSSGSGSIDLDADINTIALTGEQVLSSDVGHRFNLFERIEYIYSQLELNGAGALQEEKYGTLEVGGKYFSAQQMGARNLRWSAQLSVKAGVTGDSGTLGTYDEFQAANPGAAQVLPTARTAEFVTVLPKLGLKLPLTQSAEINFDLSAQYATEQLPQQQQWVLGGMSAIRAYLPGVLVGDTGYFMELGLQQDFDVAGVAIKGTVFAEYGAAWYDNASGAAGDERSIGDVGLRASADLGWGVNLDLLVAHAVIDDGFDDQYLDRLEADFFFVLKKVF